MVQFPESAIEDVEMFVGKVTCDLVNVFFFIDQQEALEQIRTSDLSGGDSTGMTLVDGIKNPCNDRDGILFLKFGMIGQEFQALRNVESLEGMCV